MTSVIPQAPPSVITNTNAPLPPPLPNSHSIKRRKPRHWVVEEEDNEKWKFDPNVARRINIEKVVWNESLGFTHSESGSEGVLFFGWEGDRVAVVKGSSTVLADQFTQSLGELIGMPFPKSRIVRYIFDHEFSEISDAVVRLEMNKKESERGRHQKLLTLPILLIMEFIGGKDMYEVDFEEDFKDEERKHSIMKELGRIISFDVLVNNWDRFPLIWDIEGNMGNIFFTGDENRPVVGIDQTTSCIDPEINPQGVEDYMTKVRDLLAAILDYNDTPKHPHMQRIANCFIKETGFDLKRKGMYSLWEGIMIGIKDICERITTNTLNKIYKRLDDQVTELIDTMTYGMDTASRYGLSKINLQFLEMVLTEFRKVLPDIDHLLEGLH